MADEVDRANDLYEDRRNVEVTAISRILARKNLTGECEDCGEDIEALRLAALPSARRCIKCQEEYERFTRTHRN